MVKLWICKPEENSKTIQYFLISMFLVAISKCNKNTKESIQSLVLQNSLTSTFDLLRAQSRYCTIRNQLTNREPSNDVPMGSEIPVPWSITESQRFIYSN